MKIVLIGAGSHSFGLGQIVDLMQAEELRGRGAELSLVDIDEHALDTMTKLAQRIKRHTDSDIALHSTTDRAEALPGADYVITSVARKRMELWEQDFRLPLAHGFRHCLGENGGPGALFHALRSFELIIPICRDIERHCPDALLLNFTNPESRVLHAICHLTQVKAIGICHGVFGALRAISDYLARPVEEFEIVSAGINHFYCVLSAKERATGKEWLPELVQMAAADRSSGAESLFSTLAGVFGIFTFPSEDHIGEYLSWGAEATGVKWPYGRESRSVSEDRPAGRPSLEAYSSGEVRLDERIVRPSGELTVPIIADIELDRNSLRPAVNVLNSMAYVENLPRDAVVEVPARVDGNGVHPLSVGPLPEAFAAMLHTQCAINSVITEAYRTRSKRLLLQALLLDPNVNSVAGATRLLEDMFSLQEEFLPEFS